MTKRLFTVLFLAVLAFGQAKQKKLPKPGFNLFSKEQDVQMGKEYAGQIERQMTVVQNKELTDYINRIGKRLVDRGELDPYPYFFKVVAEPSINAFALPGGPMFVHTGLIKAADNEAQIAGVLAHELAHVVLRHGTNQASKAQMIQLPAMLAGMMAGGSLTGQLAQIGIGLGANSVLLKFSRNAESDADLLGAYTMAKAGYNPIELARFFEKLESQMGASANSKVAQFLSDHPNPGNRVKAIDDQLPYMARTEYNASEGDLKKMQAVVEKVPAPAQKPAAGQGSAAPPPQAQKPANVPISGSLTQYQGKTVTFSHPSNWQVANNQGGLTVAPPEGLAAGGQVGYGVIVSAVQPPSGKVNIDSDTKQLLNGLAQQNGNVRVEGQPQKITVGGSNAYVTRLSSDSPYSGLREADTVITIDRGNVMYYVICVAPATEYARFEPVFQQIVRSVQFR